MLLSNPPRSMDWTLPDGNLKSLDNKFYKWVYFKKENLLFIYKFLLNVVFVIIIWCKYK